MSLEDDIRKALTALEGTVPDGYFDELPGRIERRLQEQAMESDMSKSGSNGDGAHAPGEAPRKKEENTGLHDIKAMAQSAKRRVSRRVTTQSDAEEQLLLGASTSMNQVVLPDPNKQVAVAVEPAVERAAAEAEREQARGGIPIWVYAAVAVVAAAAVIFFVVRGRKGEDEGGQQIAQSEQSAPAGASEPAPPPAGGAPAVTQPIDENAAAPEAEGAVVEPLEPSAGDTVAAPPAPAEDNRAGEAARPRGGKPAEDPKAPARPKTDGAKVATGGAAPPPAKPAAKPAPKDDAGRSLEDLLDEAAGPTGTDKDVGGDKPAAPPTAPARTDITRDEISSGMSKVLGRVQGCYDTHKESGTVMIAVVIDPDGTVASADATGKFASTETGLCVAQAVQKAKFPAWEGKPKKINYPFLLSP